MRTFNDKRGREWPLIIDTNALKRVRSLVDIDLLAVVERDSDIHTRLADPVTLCDVLYCLVKPTAEERSVSDEDFGAALDGDILDRASLLLLEELADFFPKPRRTMLQKVLSRGQAAIANARDEVDRLMASEEADTLIDRAIDEAFERTTSGG
jgi:hypothetical protein